MMYERNLDMTIRVTPEGSEITLYEPETGDCKVLFGENMKDDLWDEVLGWMMIILDEMHEEV